MGRVKQVYLQLAGKKDLQSRRKNGSSGAGPKKKNKNRKKKNKANNWIYTRESVTWNHDESQ